MEYKNEKGNIDSKVLSIMEEQLNQEAILYKKYLNSANSLYDSELKNICQKASDNHKKNYLRLLSYLES